MESLLQLLPKMRENAAKVNELLLCVAGRGQPVHLNDKADWSRVTANMQRGLSAYELTLRSCPEHVLRVSPLELIAKNRAFAKILAGFAVRYGLASDEAQKSGIQAQEFETEQ
jgi:hypothetical protein